MSARPLRSLDDVLETMGRMPVLMGWRWRAVATWTLILLIAVAAQGWWLGQQMQLPFSLKAASDGSLIIVDAGSEWSSLNGQTLQGLSTHLEAAPSLRLDARALQPSARWMVQTSDRTDHDQQKRQWALMRTEAMTAAGGYVWAYPRQGAPEQVPLVAKGWGGLGLLWWLMAGLAGVLACVGGLVWLSAPSRLTAAYALLALLTGLSLSWSASSLVLGLHTPAIWQAWDPTIRWGSDLLSLAAVGYGVLHYPSKLRHRHQALALCLLSCGAGAILWHQALDGRGWWWSQGLMIASLLALMGIMYLTNRRQPHPIRRVLMRALGLCVLALILLSVALSWGQSRADLHLALAQYGILAWQVFVATLVLTMPFLARTRTVFQEFSWLAVSSTVAASLDLLFVAVFSMGLFTSMTLSLFLAFGLYLCLRRNLLYQLPAGHHLTRERLFEQLYTAARQVERHPSTLPDATQALLRHVFEPMEICWAISPEQVHETAALKGQGTVLLVSIPDTDQSHDRERTLVLRHALHGQRLFTPRDVRLARYIVRQLEQARRLDTAMEQGRHEERLRIAQDLHDDIGARLLTLMYQAPTPDIEDYIRHTIQDLKTLTRGLASSSHRLSDAVSEWKRDVSHRIGAARCELSWQVDWDQDVMLSMVQWSALTRILRELVSNAIGHAQATQIQVTLSLKRNSLLLRVGDNGVGKAPDTWQHGLGLGGIRKRVKQLGGTAHWMESPAGGIVCEVLVEAFTTAPGEHPLPPPSPPPSSAA